LVIPIYLQSNAAETAKTCQDLQQMLAFFEGHAHTEDERVFCLLSKVSPETVADFTAFNLTHMNKEESIVLDLLHAHYTDQQLLETEQGILDSLPLEKKQYGAYWMLKRLSLPEIIEWYKKIQASVPEVIWQGSMQLAETILPKNQLHQLQHAVRA
jgi:hypothetical protein